MIDKNIKKYFDGNVILIKNKFFRDKRGYFTELYNYNFFKRIGIDVKFIQDNLSFSRYKNTIRGLHFQSKPMSQHKLVRVNKGAIFDVVVDIRKKSKTFGKYKFFYLSQNDGNFLYISNKFAHGFCTLKDNTEVFYKVSKQYSKIHDMSIIWNDKSLNIKWPIQKNNPILSTKDKNGITLDKI